MTPTGWAAGALAARAFAGSRLDAERVVLLVGTRGSAPPPGFDRGFPELHLEPLSEADAGRLLDAQPRPPPARGGPAPRRPLPDAPPPPPPPRSAPPPKRPQAALRLAAVADGPDL